MIARLERRARFALATSGVLERIVMRSPALCSGAEARAARYVAPGGREPTLALATRLAAAGVAVHVDRFGESVRREAEVRAIGDAYVALAGDLAALPDGVHLALDASNLGLDVSPELFGEQLARVAAALPAGRTITVGAEDAARTDAVLTAGITAVRRGDPVWLTLQANLRRSPEDADRLSAAGVPVRLVKGAYVEPLARAHAYGPATDDAFAALADRLVDAEAQVRLASHDIALVDRVLRAHRAPRRSSGGISGIEMLLGVRGADALALRDRGIGVGLYVPYGARWFRYLMRRRAEAVGA